MEASLHCLKTPPGVIAHTDIPICGAETDRPICMPSNPSDVAEGQDLDAAGDLLKVSA